MLALQVLEVDRAHRLGAGRHRDDPRRSARLQSIQQQIREQERGQVVDGKGVLQAVGGDVARRPEAPDVVDQHVEARIRVEHLRGESAYLGLR